MVVDYGKAESLSLSTTTYTSLQNKITLNTKNLVSGPYKIKWNYDWQLTSTSANFQARVQLDGVDIMTHIEQPSNSSTSQRHNLSGFSEVTLASIATHTLTLDYCTSTSSATARIQNARLEIMRD
jgi:hypothetical protein